MCDVIRNNCVLETAQGCEIYRKFFEIDECDRQTLYDLMRLSL